MLREKHTLRFVLVVLLHLVITCVTRGEWMCLEDDAILQHEFQVHVREDTPIGKVIFTLRQRNGETIIANGSTSTTGRHHQLLVNDKAANTTNWDDTSSNASSSMTETMGTISSQSGYEGVRIIGGNKNDRFKVDAITGDISVNGYLDYDIDPEYTLGITLPNDLKTLQSTCSIKIAVDDVIDWPPFYNDTCEMPTRGQQYGLDEIPINRYLMEQLGVKCLAQRYWTIFGSYKVTISIASPQQWLNNVFVSLNAFVDMFGN
ncbi:uncharacterized protein [Ptychodera flava]|uniref:uncharacterized protein n=1 Tax=Ptychodera flava TaxID=63121 RepID=UPI00396A456E